MEVLIVSSNFKPTNSENTKSFRFETALLNGCTVNLLISYTKAIQHFSYSVVFRFSVAKSVAMRAHSSIC